MIKVFKKRGMLPAAALAAVVLFSLISTTAAKYVTSSEPASAHARVAAFEITLNGQDAYTMNLTNELNSDTYPFTVSNYSDTISSTEVAQTYEIQLTFPDTVPSGIAFDLTMGSTGSGYGSTGNITGTTSDNRTFIFRDTSMKFEPGQKSQAWLLNIHADDTVVGTFSIDNIKLCVKGTQTD